MLYVKEEGAERIVVAMKRSDYAEFRDVEFSFQVMGVRDGFENMDVVVGVDALNKRVTAREDVQKRIEALHERINGMSGVGEGRYGEKRD